MSVFDSGVRIPEQRSMEKDDADDAREILIRPICKWRRKKEPRGGVVEASPDA